MMDSDCVIVNGQTEETRCSNCKEFEKLKRLSENALLEYEELCKKYEESQQQNKGILKKLEEKDREIQSLKTSVEPESDIYANLREKYEIEVVCREEAENYASKVTKENKVLKRQTVDFLSSHGGVIPIEEETDPFEQKREQLNSEIEELEKVVAEMKTSYVRLEENWKYEKTCKETLEEKNSALQRELEQSKSSLEEHKKTVLELQEANENICIDYTQLQTKYDEEFVCKDRAEKYASQLHSQTAAIKRESNILMMQVGPDEKLMKALVDIEEISEEKTELQQEYETKIEELEEKVKELSDQTQLDELQKENENMMETNSLLSSRIEKLDVQYQEIQEKYKELEKKYDDATRPPPPPPPPPLPPALHGQIKGGFMRRQSKKNKQKLIQAGVSMNAGYQSAIDEMMKRIHEGPRLNRTLKPVKKRLEIQDDIDCSAGEDFQKYLPRRHASEGNVMSPLNGNDSPFAVKLRNRRPVGSTSFDEEGAFLNNKVKKEGIEEENPQNANANTESQPTSLIQDSTDKKSSTDEENTPISPKTVPNDITASTSETDNVKSQTLSPENLTLPLDSTDAEKSLTDGSLTSKTATSPTGSLKMSSTTAPPLKSRPSVTAKPPNLVSSPTSPTQKTSVINRTSQNIPVSPTSTETGSTNSASPPWNVKLRPTPTPNIKQGISSMKKDGQEEVKLPRKGTVLAMRKQFSQ